MQAIQGNPSSRPTQGAWFLVAANAIVFTSSMCILVLELVAARLVARNMGSSLYSWTSVIGVVLGGMSLGNYLGGWLADSFKPRRLLAWLFVASSALSLSMLWTPGLLRMDARPELVSWPLWVLYSVICAFFWPAGLLGAIAPAAAKMALDHTRQAGRTVGNVYAWGALGSIAGTFLAGFVLIGAIGTQGVVCAVAAGLAALGVLTHLGQSAWAFATACVWLLLVTAVSLPATGKSDWARRVGLRLGMREDQLDETRYESNYYTIVVKDDDETPNTKKLILDSLVHSYVPMDDPTRLEYKYERIYASVTEQFVPIGRPLRAMFIGGGGYVFPVYLEAEYDCDRIDVAEIDPMVKWTAQHELTLPPDDQTRIDTHIMDARNYVDDLLRQNATAAEPVRYDLIYGDAFNDFSVPYHLTTNEFNDRVSKLLEPDGVYLINIIDIYRSGRGQFLGAYVSTVLKTFPNVYVYSSSDDGPTDERDTFIVVASQAPLGLANPESDAAATTTGTLIAAAEGERWHGEMQTLLARGRGVILTDDYAPVDNLLAPVFRER
jgi:spermidine synthase